MQLIRKHPTSCYFFVPITKIYFDLSTSTITTFSYHLIGHFLEITPGWVGFPNPHRFSKERWVLLVQNFYRTHTLPVTKSTASKR